MLCFELRRALRRAASCCAVSYRVGPRRANPRQYVYKTLDMPDCGTCRPTRKLMMKPPGVISSVLSGSVEPSRMKVEQEFLLSCAVLRRAPSCRAAPCCVWPRCAVPHGAASCCVGPRRAVCETPPLTQTNNVTVNSARRRRPSAAGRGSAAPATSCTSGSKTAPALRVLHLQRSRTSSRQMPNSSCAACGNKTSEGHKQSCPAEKKNDQGVTRPSTAQTHRPGL